MKNNVQIPLPILNRELPSFSNFVAGENNEVVEALRAFSTFKESSFILLSGISGSGVSHLMQAGAFLSSELGFQALYLSLSEVGLKSEILLNLNSMDCLYIDDVDQVFEQSDWEEALFHLYNQCKDNSKSLIMGTHYEAPVKKPKLRDLQSRLAGMVPYSLKRLSDEEKLIAIMQKFNSYGLTIQKEVAQYLLNRMPRDMRNLMNNIEKLDQVSLSAKRGITIPFIKEVFDG